VPVGFGNNTKPPITTKNGKNLNFLFRVTILRGYIRELKLDFVEQISVRR
jgi:hypothetical protein